MSRPSTLWSTQLVRAQRRPFPGIPELSAPIEASLAAVEQATAPWSAGAEYLNFVERPAEASFFFDPSALLRLQAIKAAVDPQHPFRSNHPIPAAG